MKIKSLLLISTLLLSFKWTAQCTYTVSVPYLETFSTITSPNQLPTCWAVSNVQNCQTVLTPSHAAVFYSNPPGTYYFFTNGIQLYAGAVYSMSVYYGADASTPTNWTSIGLMIGNFQTASGQMLIAQSSVIPGYVMAQLSTTFQVMTNGIYYAAIQGVANSSFPAQHLGFTNFEITAPCSFTSNQPTLTVVPSATNVCSGSAVTLTASGAYSYTWSNNAQGPVTTSTVTANPTTFMVTGANPSGCTASASMSINVNPTPVVTASANPAVLCVGTTATLSASGGNQYNWSMSSATTGTVLFTPTVAGMANVTVTGSLGTCSSSTALQLTINPSPQLVATANSFTICDGQFYSIQFTGAPLGSLDNINFLSLSSPIAFNPRGSTTYTMVGKDNNNCLSSPVYISATVLDCTGLPAMTNDSHMDVFPNPSSGLFTLQTNGAHHIEVFSSSGQMIAQFPVVEKAELDLRSFPAGIYLLKTDRGVCRKLVVSH